MLKIDAEGSRQLTFLVLAPCLISLCEMACYPVYFYVIPNCVFPVCVGRKRDVVTKYLETICFFSPRHVPSVCFLNRASALCGLR